MELFQQNKEEFLQKYYFKTVTDIFQLKTYLMRLKNKIEKKKLKKINIFMVLKDQTVPLEQEIILD